MFLHKPSDSGSLFLDINIHICGIDLATDKYILSLQFCSFYCILSPLIFFFRSLVEARSEIVERTLLSLPVLVSIGTGQQKKQKCTFSSPYAMYWASSVCLSELYNM